LQPQIWMVTLAGRLTEPQFSVLACACYKWENKMLGEVCGEMYYQYFTLRTIPAGAASAAGAATAPWKRAARAMTAAKKAENCMLR
jgi:hypothetical protein